MPRPSFPLTPAPSTDISGKSSTNAQLDSSFALPPAAISGSSRGSSSSATSNSSDSSYHPLSPSSPVATAKTAPTSRKRANTSQSVITKDNYTLPPPPTRSRKIIQMKPKENQEPAKALASASTGAKSATPAAATGSKRKQANSSTAAGRKIARKTAHSLIERRRRSKMNEEFGVLKDMIPACAGQEMHKLAILQASIEYMRYLEQCVSDLEASHRSRRASDYPTSPRQERPVTQPNENQHEEDDDDEEDEDEDMSDAVSPTHVASSERKPTYQFTHVSPAICPSDHSVYSTTTSPNIRPSDAHHYAATISPVLQPSDPHHYSLASSIRSTATSPSIQASPAFGGQTPSQTQFQNPFPTAPSSKGSISGPGGANFALTSPALGPQADREDHEATEALLMLNTDRRSWSGARGMSVKDLLSG
ncbi:hypothetical protein K469DRAFT_700934 [Zopfia rhizophila CBS 207.26]|uniref:BHLH domain-containing protein n=1 Tax=Zopfia rhizophila CBS 207.26 TaxID=1314779 RepID=A0A6A6EF60_9PEZI|nr:hypothetical protein K469DRAFT_700934 [Zopfia rhizophila CBS 207.26]